VFTRVKHDAVDKTIRRYLLKQPELAEARSWVKATLPDLVKARVKARLGLTDAEYDELLKAPKTGAPHWATYQHGSWILSKRAQIGKKTKRQTKGDPDRWWMRYNDSQTRGGWLRAYAAECVPELFEVVMVKLRDCDRCGGKGQLTHQSLKGNKNLSGGGHYWQDWCPLCFGAAKQRSVQYR
ncbi:MAG: hypothetical protein OER88_04095, partial [Planctomycetota bacterium]|nr:hypothetical protein [Planctomycetota bacterium]